MYTKAFNELSRRDAEIAGGKGASLGEMARAGIPVPPGFVVTARAFRDFLQTTGLQSNIHAAIASLQPNDLRSVRAVSETIKQAIVQQKIPEGITREILGRYQELGVDLVAVRSSATAEDGNVDAWAGQLESYLNTPAGDLMTNVQKCWASLFTERALVYRCEKGLRDADVAVAVVVQTMVHSEASGVCFTVHPVKADPRLMVIEAVWGLGELMVSGKVNPDTYVIDKNDFSILDTHVSRQDIQLVKGKSGNEEQSVAEAKCEAQKLSGREIVNLADLCAKIESHYGFPCDIEWALESGEFFIVQSRPITTLQNTNGH